MNELALKAKRCCEEGRYDEAWGIAEHLMGESPNKANPLILGSFVMWKLKRLPVAYQLGIRATQLAPREASAWINLGIAAQELWLVDEAEMAYKTAIRLASSPTEKAMAAMNMSALCIDTGRWVEAEKHARESLRHNPDSAKAKANVGFGLLGQRNWEGWEWYSHGLGLQQRLKYKFGDEPDWKGEKGKVVALYGEQGLGDEISFAAMVPDAVRDCAKVIVDCDKKLEGLFRRSFPQARVYGTRRAKETDGVRWDEADWKIDASLALGELGKFYRRSDESFTGKPYLVADPERRSMWRHHFEAKKKPVIGIAWTGGVPQTGQKFRTLSLDILKPLLESVEAHWVSLQYKDASHEIAKFRNANPQIDVTQYAWATLTTDYDDTAALAAELDLVVSVDTSVVHLCGALGKECLMLLQKYGQWRWGSEGGKSPWYESVRIFRQRELKDWTSALNPVIAELRRRYAMKEAA